MQKSVLKMGFMIFLAVVALTSHAQANPASTPARLTIGFSQVGTESDWRTAFSDTIFTEAARRNIELLFLDAENSQENQIAAIHYFIEAGVDAILLAPVIETGWNSILQEAQHANIPVVIIDRNVTADESLYLTRVSSDFRHEGRLAAAWLAQATAGRCNIVELEGTVGSSAARDRHIGFLEVMQLFPDMRITVSQPGDFRRELGQQIMEGILNTEDPSKICAVWSHNDDMAIGAVQAIKNADLDPGDDILIVSVDAIPDIFLAMMNGDTNATVELNTNMAGLAFDAIERYFNGEDVPKWIRVTGGLYFPATAAEEYARRTQ